MLKLTSSISEVPKIGPKYQTLLEKLEIKTAEDLLWHIPFRYDDFTQTKTLAELTVGETVTVSAVLGSITNIFTKNLKNLNIAKIHDATGDFPVVWFNQHYLRNSLKKGKRYFFSGKVQSFSNKAHLVSPVCELADDSEDTNLDTGRLVAIYSTTNGITSKWLRARNNDVLRVLEETNELADYLPPKILEKHQFTSFSTAFRQIHFPDNLENAEKAKKRLAFDELFLELLLVEQRKKQWRAQYRGVHVDTKSTEDALKAFTKSLTFNLTIAQEKAVSQILADLNTKNPMNRLLEGDVGSGKTIIAVIAAYITALNGLKTLYMAPTEILAKQHFATFHAYLEPLDINLALKTALKKGQSADADIIIGTHALLFENYTNVGLVVIDEQHRFGVEQRAQIAQTGVGDLRPNVLTMTATPIPRTLALTLYGDLDISVLDEVPNKNKKITTKVVSEKLREKTFAWIKQSGAQTFVVCPLIDESEFDPLLEVKAAQIEFEKLKTGIFRDVPVGLLHGRMRAKEKEQVVADFRAGKIQVLVSTPVIEVGIDIPEATVMVIESGERYGLASLHQLRGRVGRGDREGFCFVFQSGGGKASFARLKNLERETSGLKLAELDMKYRGQGDLFGTLQHGFKQFKVADVADLALLELAKSEAESVWPDLAKFKTLAQIIARKSQELISNN